MTKLNFQSNEEYLIKQNNFAMKFENVGFAQAKCTLGYSIIYDHDHQLTM